MPVVFVHIDRGGGDPSRCVQYALNCFFERLFADCARTKEYRNDQTSYKSIGSDKESKYTERSAGRYVFRYVHAGYATCYSPTWAPSGAPKDSNSS